DDKAGRRRKAFKVEAKFRVASRVRVPGIVVFWPALWYLSSVNPGVRPPVLDTAQARAWLLVPPRGCDQVAGAEAGCLVGIRRLKGSAIRAMIAITDSDERNPSRRAVVFSATMASAVFVGTPALSSAVFRSMSETNGTP